jgi:hypothetical protein
MAPTNEDTVGVSVAVKSDETRAVPTCERSTRIATRINERVRLVPPTSHQLQVMESHCRPATHEPIG